MDQFVRPSRSATAYPNEQYMQFQQHPNGNVVTLYVADSYENEYNGMQYSNAGYSNGNSKIVQAPLENYAVCGQSMNPRRNDSSVYNAYSTNNAPFMTGASEDFRPQMNTIASPSVIGQEYPNHNFVGPQRVKSGTYTAPSRALTNQNSEQVNALTLNADTHSKLITSYYKEKKHTDSPMYRKMEKKNTDLSTQRTVEGQFNKTSSESEAQKVNDKSNTIAVAKVDKFKSLQKSSLRVFSGPIEKVLKWHKALQEVGVFVFYEIVAKCVSISPGERSAKNLVIRDENGPAMQVVYYEIDFLLPKLTLPTTIRVIGRIMQGTCRLQAFSVRPATGDDVSILPRRAAVSAHHVAKLCKEHAGP